MKIDELFEKSENIFDYILKECADENGNVNRDLLDCVVDRVKSIKDKTITLEESHSMTIEEIKKQLKKFKKSNTLDIIGIDYID